MKQNKKQFTLDNMAEPKGIHKKMYKFLLPAFYRSDLNGPLAWAEATGKTLSSWIVNGLAIYGAYNLFF